MATYNGEQYLDQQVDSILRQKDVDLRLVISDDGSSDSTFEKLKGYEGDDRIEVHRSLPGSGSAAQNFLSLIRRSYSYEYDFVALADQDDVWSEQKLARACDLMLKQDISGYSGTVVAFWPNGKAKKLILRDRQTGSDFLFESAGQGCTYVFGSSFYQRLQRFLLDNEGLTTGLHFHDWAIYAVARSWQCLWYFDLEPVLRYRQHAKNELGARSGIKSAMKRVSLIRSGWYSAQILAIARLCIAADPNSELLAHWHKALCSPRGVARTFSLLKLLRRGGRRKRIHNLVLMVSISAGWI